MMRKQSERRTSIAACERSSSTATFICRSCVARNLETTSALGESARSHQRCDQVGCRALSVDVNRTPRVQWPEPKMSPRLPPIASGP
jgi:hypothetical protein